MNKLELKHLAPYLTYDLPMADSVGNKIDWQLNASNIASALIHKCKPLLRPLSDLTKDELYKFSVNFRMYYQRSDFDFNMMIVSDYNLALSMHFDVFGLIPQNLAIDLNTLKN
jgi:hypothetical protein